MARDWRRAVFAVVAAAMLSGACALGPHALAAADEEPEEEQTKDAAPDAAPKASAKKKQDPADAQRAIEAALKQLQAGRTEQAVQAVSATLAGGNLPPAILAKALYVRGMAYRQQRKPAQAVSDLTSALWLKGGLGSDDRAGAIKERAAAYADAGLSDRGEPNRAETPAKTASSNWLGNLFGASGGSDPPAPPPKAPPPPPAQAPAQKADAAPSARTPAAASGWSSKTQVQADRPALAAAPAARPAKAPEPPPRAPTEAPAARLEGKHLVQLGAVRTEAEAQALAAKAKREHAAMLASRQSSIDKAVFGNMGAFYRVRFGPFASAQETQAVCAKLQGSGLDCMPVGP
jgi:cell division septation protein DedD